MYPTCRSSHDPKNRVLPNASVRSCAGVEGQSSLSALAADRTVNVYASHDRAILKYDGATGQLVSKIEGDYSLDDVIALPNVGLLAYTNEDFVYFNAQDQEVGLSQPIRN